MRSVASSVTSDFLTLLVFSSTSFANGSKNSRTTGTHSTSPAAMRSRSSSIRTVKPVSTISGKCSRRKSVTTKPTSSGVSARPSFRTYLRSTSVEIVGAYVDGRPIPNSSSVFTSDASVKRGGGCVKCCDASSPRSLSASPSCTSGSGAISFSGSSLDSKYTRRNPSNRTRRPFRSEEHTSELQSHVNLVCRLLLEKKKKTLYAFFSDKKKITIIVSL